MRIVVLGLVLVLAGCASNRPEGPPRGVGFGGHQGGYNVVPTGVVMPAAPVRAAPTAQSATAYQSTGSMVARGLPTVHYKGRRNLSNQRLSAVAKLAKGVNSSSFGRTFTYVQIAGQRMKGHQIHLGRYHLVVLHSGTANQYFFGVGDNKAKLRVVMSDVAALTGCATENGIFSDDNTYIVPISCS